jgi:hypothetical protein|tara:strand:+ start:14 stop:352 length:339 start_codon:yes stop_codon:yes gene_type:complete
MKLANWIAENLDLMENDIEEVCAAGVMCGVRFTQYDTVNNSIKPLDYDHECTRCTNGKYAMSNGTYANCNRCDGQGFITEDKAIRNSVFDMRQKEELKHMIDSSRYYIERSI